MLQNTARIRLFVKHRIMLRRVTSRYSNLYANGVSASSADSITANSNSNTQSQNAQVIAQSDNYTCQ